LSSNPPPSPPLSNKATGRSLRRPRAARQPAPRECRRAARACVVLVDLSRSRLALAAAWLLTRLTSRNRLTRSDGVLSVRRAYTVAEAAELAQQAGWECVHAEQHGLFYYSLVWSSSATNCNNA